jgi:predicted nucleic acid-binding protein
MSVVLLDANVLIALLVEDHVHHAHAESWFVASSVGFATCPVTQGSLMRLLIREGQSVESVVRYCKRSWRVPVTSSGSTMPRTMTSR